jgi:hypothetical protein
MGTKALIPPCGVLVMHTTTKVYLQKRSVKQTEIVEYMQFYGVT